MTVADYKIRLQDFKEQMFENLIDHFNRTIQEPINKGTTSMMPSGIRTKDPSSSIYVVKVHAILPLQEDSLSKFAKR